jgi:parallel beta-helix repeat protein
MSNGTTRKKTAKVPASVWRWDHHETGGTFKGSASNGKIVVAVGDQGLIKTSGDGFTWTKRNSGQKRNIYGICYSPEKKLFVAVGYHGIVITSTTGTTWTQRVRFTQDAPSLKAVAYGGGRFVAVGVGGVVKISADGKNWRDSASAPKTEMNDIHYHNGLFVVPSIADKILITTDGESGWKSQKVASKNNNLYSVTHGKGTWIVGGAHGACFTSADGRNWVAQNTGTDNYLMDIVYTGKQFVANGNSDGYPQWGSMILVSVDGKTWWREKAPSGFNPRNQPCFSTLTTNVLMGDRVFAFGARQEIISKNIHDKVEPGTPPPPPPPSGGITLTSPKGGEKWEVGAVYDLTWEAPTVKRHVKIEYSTDNGNTWKPVDNDTKNDGIRDWTVPNDVSSKCRIRITDVGGPTSGTSGLFSIIPEGQGKRITVTAPKGGERFKAGSVTDLTWTSRNIPGHVKIEYSIDDGRTWLPLDNDTKNDGIRDWTVPDKLSTKCRIRITDNKSGTYGISPGAFTIFDTGITVTSPKDGDKWLSGSVHDLTWTSRGITGHVKIDFSSDNGQTWKPVDNDTKDDGIRDWTIPEIVSDGCKIRVSAVKGKVSGVSTGAFSIVEPDRRVQTPPPGINTLSEAVKKMKQGYVIELEVGTYVQTEAVVLPPKVTAFTIVGKGMGASVIEFKNCGGIQQTASQVGQCLISGLTLTAAQADDGNPYTAIQLKGRSRESGTASNIIIRDVAVTAGGDEHAWHRAADITNAYGPLVENLHVTGPAEIKGSGIRLNSCVSAVLSAVKFANLDTAILLDKAPDTDIEGTRKHGCEQIVITAAAMADVNKGIMLDEGSRNVKIDSCNMHGIRVFGIRERHSANGGCHVIQGGTFNFAPDAPGNLHMFWLQNSGSTVSAVTANGGKTKSNGLTLSAKTAQGTGPVEHIRVMGCMFRGFVTGIFLIAGRECVLSGNICLESTNGIFVAKDSQNNKLIGNIAPIADRGKNNQIL